MLSFSFKTPDLVKKNSWKRGRSQLIGVKQPANKPTKPLDLNAKLATLSLWIPFGSFVHYHPINFTIVQ